MANTQVGNDNYICLNVGGTLYTTTLSTLTSIPDSMLGSMFREGGIPAVKDANEHIFIDRDGPMFRYILNFMRNRKLCLPSTFEEYDQLLAEADFYQLPGLKEAILLKMRATEKEVVVVSVVSWANNYFCVVEARRETWHSLDHLTKANFPVTTNYGWDRITRPSEPFTYKCYDLIYYGHIAACLTEDGFTPVSMKTDVAGSGDNILVFTRDA